MRWLIPGGCHAEEGAGQAAGCNEDKRADGAGGAGSEEKPSSSFNHSMESSTCTDGAGTEKPTNSRSHSAESSTCTDAAGAEKPIISRTHSSAEVSASAMQAEAKPEATPKPLEPTGKWLRKRQIFLPAGSTRCGAKRRSAISGKPVCLINDNNDKLTCVASLPASIIKLPGKREENRRDLLLDSLTKSNTDNQNFFFPMG